MDGAVLPVSQEGANMKNDPEDISIAYLLYVVPGIVLLAVDPLILVIRKFLALQ
jgi:hypothetical protein